MTQLNHNGQFFATTNGIHLLVISSVEMWNETLKSSPPLEINMPGDDPRPCVMYKVCVCVCVCECSALIFVSVLGLALPYVGLGK